MTTLSSPPTTARTSRTRPWSAVALEEQFRDLDQQHHSAVLGMWVFLATEVMFFGSLFVGLAVYRYKYPLEFETASGQLCWQIGGINTIVLLGQQLDGRPGRALRPARPQRSRRALSRPDGAPGSLLPVLQGRGVLHRLPRQPDSGLAVQSGGMGHAARAESPTRCRTSNCSCLFYWIMTVIHALHVTLGMVAMLILLVLARRKLFLAGLLFAGRCHGALLAFCGHRVDLPASDVVFAEHALSLAPLIL